MFNQLLHTKRHIMLGGGWQESLGVEVESGPIKGSWLQFLRTVIEHVQTRFDEV